MTMNLKKLIIVIVLFCLFIFSCNKAEKNKNKSNKPLKKTENKSNKVSKDDLKTIIQINDKKITNKDFKDFLSIKYPELIKVKIIKQSVYNALLEYFIEHKLVYLEAKSKKINASNKEINEFLSKLSKNKLKINKQIIKEFIINQKYLYLIIYKDIKINEKEIKKYYNSHLNEFRKKQEIFLHQILVKDKDKAIQIRGKLLNKPSLFEEFAKTYSLAPDATNGGMMGYFEKGILPKDLEKIVFSLKINEISPIVKSSYGYHIFKISKKKNSRLLYYSKVKDKIEKKLLAEKYNIIYNDLINSLKKKYTIKKITQNIFFNKKNKINQIKEVNNEENNN